MIYKPNKKELEQLGNLNKGYKLLKEGIDLIIDNAPQDSDVSVYSYRVRKNISKLISSISRALERKFITNEFNNIVKDL